MSEEAKHTPTLDEIVQKYADPCKHNAEMLATMPISVVRQQFRECVDEATATLRTKLESAEKALEPFKRCEPGMPIAIPDHEWIGLTYEGRPFAQVQARNIRRAALSSIRGEQQ